MRELANCADGARWRTTMHRLLDDEASSADERSLRTHLEECPECAAAWDELSWVVEVMRTSDAVADSALVEPTPSVDSAAPPETPWASPRPARTVGLRWGSAAAAVLLLGLVLWSVPPLGAPDDPDSPRRDHPGGLTRIDDATPTTPANSPSPTSSAVEVVSTSDELLAVPIDSLDPSVQIVWLYETHPRKVGTP